MINTFLEKITVKGVFWGSLGISSFVFFCFNSQKRINTYICNYQNLCVDFSKLIQFFLLFFVPIFLLSLFFLFKKNRYDSFFFWKKVTIYAYIAYLIIVTIIPWQVGDAFFGFTKGIAAILLCFLYFFISLFFFFQRGENK